MEGSRPPYLIVELVDYTCSHCREMYHFIEAARKHYPGQIAVVVRPVALEQACNPYLRNNNPKHKDACKYTRLALAVWHADSTRFAELHHWLMKDKSVPPVTEAVAYAANLIGHEQVRSGIRHPDVIAMLGDNHYVWNQVDANLPMLFLSGRLVQGMPHSDREFFEVLEQQFRIAARPAE